MDILSNTRCLYPLGYHRDVSRETVLYDLGVGNNWRIPTCIFGTTYALREPEILAARDTSTNVETDWIGVVCRVLFNLRDYHCLSESACALCFSDFWIKCSALGRREETCKDTLQPS